MIGMPCNQVPFDTVITIFSIGQLSLNGASSLMFYQFQGFMMLLMCLGNLQSNPLQNNMLSTKQYSKQYSKEYAMQYAKQYAEQYGNNLLSNMLSNTEAIC